MGEFKHDGNTPLARLLVSIWWSSCDSQGNPYTSKINLCKITILTTNSHMIMHVRFKIRFSLWNGIQGSWEFVTPTSNNKYEDNQDWEREREREIESVCVCVKERFMHITFLITHFHLRILIFNFQVFLITCIVYSVVLYLWLNV